MELVILIYFFRGIALWGGRGFERMGRLSHIGVEVRLTEYINSMVAAIFMNVFLFVIFGMGLHPFHLIYSYSI